MNYLIRYTDATRKAGAMFTEQIRAESKEQARTMFEDRHEMAVFGKGKHYVPGAVIWFIHEER